MTVAFGDQSVGQLLKTCLFIRAVNNLKNDSRRAKLKVDLKISRKKSRRNGFLFYDRIGQSRQTLGEELA